MRYQSAWRLGRDGAAANPAVPAFVRRLNDEHARVRATAAEALERIGPLAGAAVPALLDALGDPHQAVRWKAAQALSSIGLPSTEWPRLADALTHRDEYVRAFAAFSLGEMVQEGRPAASALAAAVSDPDRSVRAVVVMALAKIGAAEPPVIVALERALADRTWQYRWRAARALGRIQKNTGGSVASLAAALAEDDDVKVRCEAARALGRFGRGAQAAIPTLSAARRDPDSDVRETAAWALRAAMGEAPGQPPSVDATETASRTPAARRPGRDLRPTRHSGRNCREGAHCCFEDVSSS